MVKVKDFSRETSKEPEAIKQMISSQPYTAGISLCSSLRFYKGGIFDDDSCGKVGINHSVLIIGYGTELDNEYWIIKNSLGLQWGEKGFARIKMMTKDVEGLKSKMQTGGYARLLGAAKYAPILIHGD